MDKATEELYEKIKSGAKFGGPVALTEVTHLKPAGGDHELIAPAKYLNPNAKSKGETGTYVFEVRFIEGKPVNTVLIDSRSSAVNRMEQALQDAIDEDCVEALRYIPRIKVTVPGPEEENGFVKTSYTDLELPHRAFDSNVRFAKEIQDEKSESHKRYDKARKATQRNALDLFNLSPITVLFGGWDAHEGIGTKFPSAVVSETTGYLARQDCKPEETIRRRSGAKIDPGVKSKKEGAVPEEGIGMLPPRIEAVDCVSVKDIIRTHILSFSTLRQLRFYDAGEKIAEKNESIRTLLACVAIYGFVAANENLAYRSQCLLSLKELPKCIIEYSSGDKAKDIGPITIDQAKELLDKAFNEVVDLFKEEEDCPVWAMKDLEKAIFPLEWEKPALKQK